MAFIYDIHIGFGIEVIGTKNAEDGREVVWILSCARQKGSDTLIETFCGCHICMVPLQTPPINPRFKWSGNDKNLSTWGKLWLSEDSTHVNFGLYGASPAELEIEINCTYLLSDQRDLVINQCKSKGYPSLQGCRYYWLHASIMLLSRKLLCFCYRRLTEVRTDWLL